VTLQFELFAILNTPTSVNQTFNYLVLNSKVMIFALNPIIDLRLMIFKFHSTHFSFQSPESIPELPFEEIS